VNALTVTDRDARQTAKHDLQAEDGAIVVYMLSRGNAINAESSNTLAIMDDARRLRNKNDNLDHADISQVIGPRQANAYLAN
jgi:hypothetical protein